MRIEITRLKNGEPYVRVDTDVQDKPEELQQVLHQIAASGAIIAKAIGQNVASELFLEATLALT